MPDSKQQIRSAMRRQRQSLSVARQQHNSQQLATQIARQAFFLRIRRIALYLANDGEINPDALLQLAIAAGKKIFLPVLHPFSHNRLHFLPHSPGQPLIVNRFGIGEPPLGRDKPVPPWCLDAVFFPLVAFDRSGNRLGMGGGFYDRTFARCHATHRFRPLFIGLAHSFQEVDSLPCEPWDIPLDAIATEAGVLLLNPSQRRP